MRDENEELYDANGDPNPEARDYGPNELAELRRTNPEKYRRVVQSNLEEGDTIERWQERNLKSAQEYLAQQRRRT